MQGIPSSLHLLKHCRRAWLSWPLQQCSGAQSACKFCCRKFCIGCHAFKFMQIRPACELSLGFMLCRSVSCSVAEASALACMEDFAVAAAQQQGSVASMHMSCISTLDCGARSHVYQPSKQSSIACLIMQEQQYCARLAPWQQKAMQGLHRLQRIPCSTLALAAPRAAR